MEIKEFYSLEDKEYWKNQIKNCDWEAGQLLYHLLNEDKLKEWCGEETKVFLLADQQSLVSFCTFAGTDDVRDTELGPWVGFVYTFPQYRGHRYVEFLLNFAYETAKNDGAGQIYISTGETGLYEQYGYSFFKMMSNANGENSRVYKIEIK